MDIQKIKSILSEKLGDEYVIENADMSQYCSFKCGGKASLLVKAEDMDALRYALYVISGADKMFQGCGSCCGGNDEFCEKSLDCDGCMKACSDDDVPYMVIGNGSNILVRDGGFDGIIIKLGESFANVYIDGDKVVAGAAALLSTVSKIAAAESLTGMEFASGIPGSIGGAVFMNAGAYDGEMKNIIKSVKVISKDGLREYQADVSELDLSYRHSIFTSNGDIITEVELELQKGVKSDIYDKMKDLAERRNTKQPLKYPSAGSFFKRPTGYFAGALIEGAGLKGLSVGGAQVSELHAGFVINTGNATATDIIKLMHLVQNTVMDKDSVMLEPEVKIIGKDL